MPVPSRIPRDRLLEKEALPAPGDGQANPERQINALVDPAPRPKNASKRPKLRSTDYRLPTADCQAATFASLRCHGVSIRGPSGVIAMVCSKWLVSVPSSE